MKQMLIAGVLVIGMAMPAAAQTCLGAMTFEKSPMRVGGSLSFASNSQTLAGGIGRGGTMMRGGQATEWFVGLGGALESVSDLEGAGKGVYFNAGAERAVGSAQKYFVCPMAAIIKTWGGLSPALDTTINGLVISLGANVGYTAMTSGTTRIVPFGGFSFDSLHSSWSGTFDFSDTESFTSLQLGVGLILNERLAIRPAVSLPLGSETADPTFTVLFTKPLGK